MITKEQFFEYLYSQDYEYLCNDLEKEEVFIQSLINYRREITPDKLTRLIDTAAYECKFASIERFSDGFIIVHDENSIKEYAKANNMKLTDKQICRVLTIMRDLHSDNEPLGKEIICDIIRKVKTKV